MVVGWVEVMVANVEGISQGDGGDSQTWKLEVYSTCNNQKGFHQRYGVQGFVGKVIVRVNQRLNRSGVQKAVMKLENSTSP